MACRVDNRPLVTASVTTWLDKVHASRVLPDGRRVEITAGVVHLRGNARPFFSATATVYPDATSTRVLESGYLPVFVEAFPELAPVYRLHMAADDGEPLRDADYVWFWLSAYYGGLGEPFHAGNVKQSLHDMDGKFLDFDYATPTLAIQEVAKITRTKVNAMARVAVRLHEDGDGSRAGTKARFASWWDAQRGRWKRDAQDAHAALYDFRHRQGDN